MRLLRSTVSTVTALALFIHAAGLAQADPPREAVWTPPELPGISPPPQGRPTPAPTGDSRPDGVTLMALGTLAIAGGVILIVYGYEQGVSTVPCSYCAADLGAEVGGVTLGAAGIAGVIIGAVLFGGSSSPHAKASSDLLLPKTLARPNDAWLRAPVWQDSTRNGPARMGMSLFSRSF